MRKQPTKIFLCVALIALFPSAAPAGDWPQWRHDAARSAASPDELPEQLHLQWARQLPAPRPAWPPSQPSLRFDVSYSPVAAGKMLFVPSMVTDSVTAYDTESGEQRWRFFAEGPVRLAPVSGNGKVYFGSDDGYLYCVDAAGGRLLWRFRGGPSDRKVLGNERLISTWPVRTAPLLHDGKIYFTAGIWCFMGIFAHAVDAETGKAVWTNSGFATDYQPQPHGDAVSFAGFVPRGYPAATGKLLTVPGGRTPPGQYDPATGKLVEFDWAQKGGRCWNITGDGTSIKAGSRTVSASDGQVVMGRWKGPFRGKPWNVLAADGKLFVVTTAGRIYCFGAKRGKPKTYALAALPEARKPDTKPGALAAAVMKAAAGPQGYCVMLGLGSGELAEELIRASKLHLIVVDPDAKKIDAFRRRMTDAGWYGTRLSAHVGDPSTYPLPPYLAGLVLSEDLRAAGAGRSVPFIRQIFRVLRPYGGAACLRSDSRKLGSLTKTAGLAGAEVRPAGKGWSVLLRPGALPGAADWTHHYADAGASVVSQDTLVKAPLGLLWFGNGPANDEVLPRHGHGPSPQVAAGRLLVEGPDMIRAMDIYTGRLLWQKELKGLGEFFNHTGHQPGAGEIGGNYVTLPDAVYVVYGEKILRLDAATGKTLGEFTVPAAGGGAAPAWGYIGVWQDVLVATSSPVGVSKKGFTPARYSSASKRLVVMDRQSGKVLWTRDAKYNFRHNNIALGAGKVFCIDALSRRKQDALKRRGKDPKKLPDYKPRLLALDIRTGKEIWSTGRDVFGTFLNYSARHDVLLQSGSAYRDRARDESNTGMAAYRGKDGKVIWKELGRRHDGPCMLHRDTIIAQGPAFSLPTGKPKMRKHPLSGEPIPWKFTRTYGCNTAVAARNLITFRSGAAGYYDLLGDGGTGNFGGFRSSCTSNLIVAGGLLSAPEYTRTCTCNYQNQTSLAMVHDPDAETWTFNSFAWDGKPVRRVGINFGAPGDRRAESGTLWMDWPSRGGQSPDIPVAIDLKEPRYFRHHSSRIRVAGGRVAGAKRSGAPGFNGRVAGAKRSGAPGFNWVAASGVEGVGSVTLTLANDRKTRRYTVRLHFADTESRKPLRRTFDVALQDKVVLKDFDVVKQAGGVNRAVVKEFKGVEVAGQLKISLGGKSPLLCGVEVVAEGW